MHTYCSHPRCTAKCRRELMGSGQLDLRSIFANVFTLWVTACQGSRRQTFDNAEAIYYHFRKFAYFIESVLLSLDF